MRKLFTTTALATVISLGMTATAPQPARAQMTVIDPSAIAQAVKQVSQQLQQIQQLQAQLTNQAAMLQKLGTNVTGPLQSITSQATQLLQQAQGMGARVLVRMTRCGYNFPCCGGIGTPLPLHLTGEQVKGINLGHCRGGRCDGRPIFLKGRWPPCPNLTSDPRAALQGGDGELWQQMNSIVRRMIPGH